MRRTSIISSARWTGMALFCVALFFTPLLVGCSCSTRPPVTPAKTTPATGANKLFDNGNIMGVQEGGKSPTVEFKTPVTITEISTYHYNQGKGATPGEISLVGGGRTYGPWSTVGYTGQGDVKNAGWTAKPDAVVPAGTYTVIDSDPATWSQNSESGGLGFVTILGAPVGI